jgi:MATE family multidrug resistance protein
MLEATTQSELETSGRSPLSELLRLAAPTVAQMASYTVMQFLDTWMLSHTGDKIIAPTAAANSGILAFSVISVGMGVSWIVNTLVSQAYGRKDYRACGQFLWQGVWFGFLFWLPLLPFLVFVPRAFAAMGHEPELVRQESVYLQIVVALSVLKLVGSSFDQFLLAVDRASLVMVATMIGIAANAIAAWAMIFGHLGCPAMGVVGAAWAQNIGVGVESLVKICFAFSPAIRTKFNVTDWRLRSEQLRQLVRIGVPTGLQVMSEVLAWGAWVNLVLALFGTRAMAGVNFVFRYMAVSFMPAFGIGTAVTALTGRHIGRRRPDLAMQRAHLGFKVSMIYMLPCGLAFILFRRPMMALFTDDPETMRLGSRMLIFAGVYQLFDAAYIVYNGALRGAGDTFIPGLMTATLGWLLTVGGGYAIARFVPGLGTAGPWLLASAYGAGIGLYMYVRFIRGKWKAIDLEQPPAADKVPNFNLATES